MKLKTDKMSYCEIFQLKKKTQFVHTKNFDNGKTALKQGINREMYKNVQSTTANYNLTLLESMYKDKK